MEKRGKVKYVPKNTLKELEDIRMEYGVSSQAEAFRLMANNSKFTRDTRQVMKKVSFGLLPKKKRRKI